MVVPDAGVRSPTRLGPELRPSKLHTRPGATGPGYFSFKCPRDQLFSRRRHNFTALMPRSVGRNCPKVPTVTTDRPPVDPPLQAGGLLIRPALRCTSTAHVSVRTTTVVTSFGMTGSQVRFLPLPRKRGCSSAAEHVNVTTPSAFSRDVPALSHPPGVLRDRYFIWIELTAKTHGESRVRAPQSRSTPFPREPTNFTA